MKHQNIKTFIACLIVGLIMGFLATLLSLDMVIGFSPYAISIPAAFSPYFVGNIRKSK